MVTPTEPIIIAKNQPAMNVSTGIIHTPQVLKMHKIQELITFITLYNTGLNRTPKRFSRTVIDGYTPASSGS